MSEHDICGCGHPRSSHAVRAPHYCHDDCRCDAFTLGAPEVVRAALVPGYAALVDAARMYVAAVERDEGLASSGHYSFANEADRKTKLTALRAALGALR